MLNGFSHMLTCRGLLIVKSPWLKILLLAILLVQGGSFVSAQQRADYSSTLGWDLSYRSVLERNKVKDTDFCWQIENYQSPILPILEAWKGPSILSAVLIEFPAGHGNEHGVLGLIRTKDKAYFYLIMAGTSLPIEKGELELSLYDSILNTVDSWRQAGRPEHSPDTVMAIDYCGFLSVYDGRSSKQLVLTSEDCLVVNGQNEYEKKDGRVIQILNKLSEQFSKK